MATLSEIAGLVHHLLEYNFGCMGDNLHDDRIEEDRFGYLERAVHNDDWELGAPAEAYGCIEIPVRIGRFTNTLAVQHGAEDDTFHVLVQRTGVAPVGYRGWSEDTIDTSDWVSFITWQLDFLIEEAESGEPDIPALFARIKSCESDYDAARQEGEGRVDTRIVLSPA